MTEPTAPATASTSLPSPRDDFEWADSPWGPALVCRRLRSFHHGWTTRLLGIERGNQQDGHGWRRLAADAGVTLDEVVRLRQVHGTRVVEATAPATVPPEADAVMTRDRRFLLTVQVADCVPILIGDFATGAAAAVHAGWRGTAAGIGGRTVAELTRAFGSAPAHLVAAIGPSIGPCCYEVGRELRDVFLSAGWPEASISRWFREDEPRLDLWQANRDQLIAAGVPAESISVSALCTACHPAWFHSYRRDRERAGRMIGYIRSTNSSELIPQSSPLRAASAAPRPWPRWRGRRRPG